MHTQIVQVKTIGNVFISIKVLHINGVQYIPSFIVVPKNKKIFKHFVKTEIKPIQYQGISYYGMCEEETGEITKKLFIF